jgi:hypothetical protein
VVVGFTSGLLPTDLQVAPSRELTATRRVELAKSIEKIRPRMKKADEWQELVNLLKRVGDQQKRRTCPDAVFQFSGDMFTLHNETEDSEEAEPIIEVRQTSMWPNLSTQNAARSLRTALVFSANNLVVGHYVAYVGRYTNDTAEDMKQECWVGEIKSLAHNTDDNDNIVEIKRWHRLDNMSCDTRVNPTYRAWQHSRDQPTLEWIEPQRILFQFSDVTQHVRVQSKYRKSILAALQLFKLNKQQPSDPTTMGLGPEQHVQSKRRRITND